MGFRNLGISFLGMIFLISARVSGQVNPPPQAAGYKMAFHDEFNTLDLSQDGRAGHTWYSDVWFSHKPAPLANIASTNSALLLTWKKGQGNTDTSITTLSKDKKQFQAWTYGYFEARMKWDVVKGAWPAFWMIPVEDATGASTVNGVKDSGEIDIFEGLGEAPRTYYATLHEWVNLKDRASVPNYFKIPDGANFSDYHVYGLLWTPGKVTWYFDNQPIHSEKTAAIFDRERFFLVLGMQEGVNWKAGNLAGVTANQMTLYVDFVRVWQK